MIDGFAGLENPAFQRTSPSGSFSHLARYFSPPPSAVTNPPPTSKVNLILLFLNETP